MCSPVQSSYHNLEKEVNSTSFQNFLLSIWKEGSLCTRKTNLNTIFRKILFFHKIAPTRHIRMNIILCAVEAKLLSQIIGSIFPHMRLTILILITLFRFIEFWMLKLKFCKYLPWAYLSTGSRARVHNEQFSKAAIRHIPHMFLIESENEIFKKTLEISLRYSLN